MQDPLRDLATVPAVPFDPAVLAIRGPLGELAASVRAIPDAALERAWRWRPTDPTDVDVRYGLYRVHERFASAITALTIGWEGGGPAIGPAIPPLRAATTARWELQGLLASLEDAAWDADPGGGEWTIRRTLGHIIGGQRSYGWFNAWYLSRGALEGEAVYPPDGTFAREPSDDEAESFGTPAELRVNLNDVVDAVIGANAGLDQAAMSVGARWSGLQVPIAFRLGRYGSHIREHTIQVDKTLAMLGRQPSEVDRLVRLILTTYGQLEAQFVGRAPAELERAFADGSSPRAILRDAVADAVKTAASVRSAAG